MSPGSPCHHFSRPGSGIPFRHPDAAASHIPRMHAHDKECSGKTWQTTVLFRWCRTSRMSSGWCRLAGWESVRSTELMLILLLILAPWLLLLMLLLLCVVVVRCCCPLLLITRWSLGIAVKEAEVLGCVVLVLRVYQLLGNVIFVDGLLSSISILLK